MIKTVIAGIVAPFIPFCALCCTGKLPTLVLFLSTYALVYICGIPICLLLKRIRMEGLLMYAIAEWFVGGLIGFLKLATLGSITALVFRLIQKGPLENENKLRYIWLLFCKMFLVIQIGGAFFVIQIQAEHDVQKRVRNIEKRLINESGSYQNPTFNLFDK